LIYSARLEETKGRQIPEAQSNGAERITMALRGLTTFLIAFGGFMGGDASGADQDASGSLPEAAPLVMSDGVRDKNFYLCHLLESSSAEIKIRTDASLTKLMSAYRSRLRASLQSCGMGASCYVAAARLTDAEVNAQIEALRGLFDREEGIRAVARRLRESGIMQRSRGDSDRQLLEDVWRASATGIDGILAKYGDGMVPRTGDIDSMSQDPRSEAFGALVRTVTRTVLSSGDSTRYFFSDPVQIAELVLEINGRDEAGRFEPLESGENAPAIERMAHIAWDRYPYSIILVPGDGPNDPGVRLSGAGRLRLAMAVSRYRGGAAPFILVSGGFVHPPRTPFSEALEMKRALIEKYHVAVAAILIDPHARHTTTNFRNAARMLYRDGAPFTKTALAVTDEYQADGIMEKAFDERNIREIGILPYLSKRRISPLEIEFVPSVDALQVNWDDPLDP
jgi:hypothetical protein